MRHLIYRLFLCYESGLLSMQVEVNLLAPELYFNFSTPCIKNVNNTGTKYVRIMKQTSFLRGKNGEYVPRLKFWEPIIVEYIYKIQLWRLAVRYVNYS